MVSILADGSAGSGVYVRPDLVLTTAALVGHATVVDVTSADGVRVLGLVARTDPPRNLSLVQVGRPGAPVLVHDGAPVAAGRAIEGIIPSGSGLATTAGRYLGPGAVVGDGLASMTALVYIEAPAAVAQPEATPWFLGDALVGLSTGSADDQVDEPFGAIGASEILDFLYGTGGALAALG